jgi:hypothetical protein
VQEGELGGLSGVLVGYGPGQKGLGREFGVDVLAQPQQALGFLDPGLPDAGRAETHLVLPVSDEAAGHRAEPGVIVQPPEQVVGVQQQPHSSGP